MRYLSYIFAAVLLFASQASAQNFANNDVKAPLVALSAAGAGTTDSASQVNTYGKGVVVGINISAKLGTIAVTVAVQGYDFVSGVWYQIAISPSISTAAFSTLTVYPGVTTTANVAVSAVLPATWRVEVVSGTGLTPSVTMTVGASVIE